MTKTDPETLRERIRERGRALGLARVGFADASAGGGAEGERLAAWLSRGHHGSMAWLARDPGRRADPRRVLPGVRTVVVASAPYDVDRPRTRDRPRPGETGWVSRYAWGDDYHDWMLDRMHRLREAIEEILGGESPLEPPLEARVYVDTGPVLEKAWAERAGVGWIGKNTCLIGRDTGSFVFLGVVLLTAAIPPDPPGVDHCGSCTACLDVCPTDAFPEPYVLDATRCISYLTIEHRGPLDPDLEPHLEGHVFGCDLCQDVCPWNRAAPTTDDPRCQPREGLMGPDLGELAALDVEGFRERFRRSPVKRTKRRGLRRNLALALGGAARPDAAALLADLAADPEPDVAATARRVLARLGRATTGAGPG